MKKKNLAFTLAEVLIVIGIIGVVAALTLPNLNHATGDKERVTKVKKIYSSLTDAFDRAQVVYGDFDTWFDDLSTTAAKNERFAKRVTEFMKISKDCGFNEGCFLSGPYIALSGGNYYSNYLSYLRGYNTYMLTLADGISLGFSASDIYIDIDGPNKGLNKGGSDIFSFNVSDNNIGACPKNITDIYGTVYNFLVGTLFSSGGSAACWIIENDNADYLKADSSGKCNDSNIILDGVTNTSCH